MYWDITAILQTWGQFRGRSHKCRISEMKNAGPQKKMSSDGPAVLICVNLCRDLWRHCRRSRQKLLCIDSAECGVWRRLTEPHLRLYFKCSRYACSQSSLWEPAFMLAFFRRINSINLIIFAAWTVQAYKFELHFSCPATFTAVILWQPLIFIRLLPRTASFFEAFQGKSGMAARPKKSQGC